MGNLVIELTESEANMMTNTGNRLITVTLPAPYLRKESPYPIGYEKINLVWLPHLLMKTENLRNWRRVMEGLC